MFSKKFHALHDSFRLGPTSFSRARANSRNNNSAADVRGCVFHQYFAACRHFVQWTLEYQAADAWELAGSFNGALQSSAEVSCKKPMEGGCQLPTVPIFCSDELE